MNVSVLRWLVSLPELPQTVRTVATAALVAPIGERIQRLRELVTTLVRETSLNPMEARWLVRVDDEVATGDAT